MHLLPLLHTPQSSPFGPIIRYENGSREAAPVLNDGGASDPVSQAQ
jgi:hypothetical protein